MHDHWIYGFRLVERVMGCGATQPVGLVASNKNRLDIAKAFLVYTRHHETWWLNDASKSERCEEENSRSHEDGLRRDHIDQKRQKRRLEK